MGKIKQSPFSKFSHTCQDNRMRIVMPLFDFYYEGSEEFEFDKGRYKLSKFIADNEIPDIEGLSNLDIEYMRQESWALVTENPDLSKYKEEINLLLLAFKIYKLSRLFIVYRLCKDDTNFCSKINETMQTILPEKSFSPITFDDLKIIDKGFSNLLKMDSISNRTHNALYFLYLGFFNSHWFASFIFLMSALEALFSKEEKGEATKTICSRVSKFLKSKPRCTYNDIDSLYDIRSRMLHGNIKADDTSDNLEKLHHLEYIVTECMKEISNEDIYLKYSDMKDKENYYNDLTKNNI